MLKTVKDYIDVLSKFPPETIVVQAIYDENGFIVDDTSVGTVAIKTDADGSTYLRLED